MHRCIKIGVKARSRANRRELDEQGNRNRADESGKNGPSGR